MGIIRVWQATFAGDETGTVVVSIDYPDLASLAHDAEIQATSAEVQAWIAGLASMRKIVSDSLYQELDSGS